MRPPPPYFWGTKVKLLNKPYPLIGRWSTSLRTALGFGGFVFLFLFIFRPFGLAQVQSGVLWYCLAFGSVTFAGISAVELPMVLSRPVAHLEDRWTVGLEIVRILLIVLIITAGNVALAVQFRFFDLSAFTFLLFTGFTLAIGFFPLTFMVMFRQVRFFREHVKHSVRLNEGIPAHTPGEDTHVIAFDDEDGRHCISLSARHVLFISAADNYVEVYYMENGTPGKILIRNSLKNMTAALEREPDFFRCHRSFLVNLRNIQKVEGNARGYLLHFHPGLPAIPVSRARLEAFDSFMTAL